MLAELYNTNKLFISFNIHFKKNLVVEFLKAIFFSIEFYTDDRFIKKSYHTVNDKYKLIDFTVTVECFCYRLARKSC